MKPLEVGSFVPLSYSNILVSRSQSVLINPHEKTDRKSPHTAQDWMSKLYEPLTSTLCV